MAAEWQLRAFRVDWERFAESVRAGGDGLRENALRRAREDGNADDPRLGRGVTLGTVLDELITGKLDEAHGTAYRIALEPLANVIATRLTFDVGEGERERSDTLTTYALRDELAALLTALGLPTLAAGWDSGNVAWPWQTKAEAKPVHWPSASYWSAAELARARDELRAAPALSEERVSEHVDESDAPDMLEALRVIVQLPALAQDEGLLVLLDGEQ